MSYVGCLCCGINGDGDGDGCCGSCCGGADGGVFSCGRACSIGCNWCIALNECMNCSSLLLFSICLLVVILVRVGLG